MFINHCHVFPEGTLSREHVELGTLPVLKSFMEECKIDKVAAFSPPRSWMPRDTFYQLKVENGNDWLHESLKQYKNMYAVISGEPGEKDSCNILREYSRKGFIGIKIHPPCLEMRIDDPVYDEYYATAEALGLFVIFHTGVHGWILDHYEPKLIDNVAYRHPELNIIVEHMGEPYHFHQAMAVVRNSKFFNDTNVYAGLTGVVSEQNKSKILHMMETIGSERMIYGIDFPQLSRHPDFPKNPQPAPPHRDKESFERHLKILNSLGLDSKDIDNILGNTLEKLIRK